MPLFGSDDKTPPLTFSIPNESTFTIDMAPVVAEGQPTHPPRYQITITNTTTKSYMYKIKLSNFELFQVTPYQGIIENGGKVVVNITVARSIKEINFMDPKQISSRFLAEYCRYKPKMGPFESAWKGARHHGEQKAAAAVAPKIEASQQGGMIGGQSTTATSTTLSTRPGTAGSTSSSITTTMTSSTTKSNRQESRSTSTQTPQPAPLGFFSYKFVGKVMPPSGVPKNYTEFLEQKVASQEKKLTNLSWLLAEQVAEIKQLEEQNSRLLRTVQRLELEGTGSGGRGLGSSSLPSSSSSSLHNSTTTSTATYKSPITSPNSPTASFKSPNTSTVDLAREEESLRIARRRIHESDLHDDLLAQMRQTNSQTGATHSRRYHKALDNAMMTNKIQNDSGEQFSNAAAHFSAQFQAMSDAMRDHPGGVNKGSGDD